jgi:hypothetical protein
MMRWIARAEPVLGPRGARTRAPGNDQRAGGAGEGGGWRARKAGGNVSEFSAPPRLESRFYVAGCARPQYVDSYG